MCASARGKSDRVRGGRRGRGGEVTGTKRGKKGAPAGPKSANYPSRQIRSANS